MSAGLLQCIQNTTEANCITATGNAPCETTKSIKGSSGKRRGRNRRRLPKDRRRGSDRSDCRHRLRRGIYGSQEALSETENVKTTENAGMQVQGLCKRTNYCITDVAMARKSLTNCEFGGTIGTADPFGKDPSKHL